MPASSTPHTEGRDTARERGLPGQVGAVVSKDSLELAATSRIFCLWDAPESIQGVSTGPCSLSGASREQQSCPWDSVPPGWFTTLSLGSFPFPKGNASLGLPYPQVWKRALGHPVFQSSAVEHCWSWVCQGDAQHRRAWGRDECQGLPLRSGNLVQALPQRVPCPGCHRHGHAPGFLHRHITASSFSGCPWAPTPDSIFISLSQNSPWPVVLHQESFLPLQRPLVTLT